MVDQVTVRYKPSETDWEEAKWLVIYPSGGANSFNKKSQAVMEGRRYAKSHLNPIELVIEKMNGDVSKMHKYGFR